MDCFVGEIRLFPWDFAPKGWATCAGQAMGIAQNQALFALLGTYYGGDGRTTFNLPNLCGRTPVHMANNAIGQVGGAETVKIDTSSLPRHAHTMNGTTAAGNISLASNGLPATAGQSGTSPTVYIYSTSPTNVALASDTIGMIGGSAAHNNMQPFLVLNPCIALTGIFPSRS